MREAGYSRHGTSGEVELRGGDNEARPLGEGTGIRTRKRRPPLHVDEDRRRELRAPRG